MVAAKGAYYTDADGRQIFDGLSGLWTCGAGHGREEITRAVSAQIAEMDYSPGFQFGHALSFQLANKIVDLTPDGLDQAMPPLNWVVRNALSAARVYS
jgi:beta-alanine--pyruvate transaminase